MKGCGRLFEPPLQESPTQPWLTCTHRLDAVPPRTSQPAPVGAAREPPTRAVPGSRPLPVAGNGPCSRPIPTIGEPPFHQRRTVRLAGRDYSADGAYFVTVCTVDREPVFGAVVDGHVRLNALGELVAEAWRWLPMQYPYASLDEWCVMPDHLHGLLVLGGSRFEVGGSRAAPAGDVVTTNVDAPLTRRKPVGELIGAFKTVSTKNINALRGTPGALVWQRDFWDRVVRNEDDLLRIRAYIRDNIRV